MADSEGRYPGDLSGDGVTLGAEGVSGGALSLNAASGGVVRMGNVLGLTGTPYSVSAWCKTPVGDSTTEAVILAKHTPWIENGYILMLNGSGGAVAGYSSVGGFLITGRSVNDGGWHHLVMTVIPNEEMHLYIDGGSPVVSAKPGTVVPNTAEFMIGGIDPPPPARRFNGWIDDVQIYSKALTQAEVEFLRSNPGLPLGAGSDIVFSPPGGVLPSGASVRLWTGIQGGGIRYTTDGSEPVATSRVYSAPLLLDGPSSTTVRARVFVNGFPVTEVRSATYQRDSGLRFSPPAGVFTNHIEVSISSTLTGVRVHYTLDGSVPTSDSAVYQSPIRLTAATTLRARAYLNGFPVTEVGDSSYQRVYAFDNDGISSLWREKHFGSEYRTDPRAGASADPDADGSTNLQEFAAGSDPLDPASGFGIWVRAVPEVRFATIVGQKYRILRKSAVDGASWVAVGEVVATSRESVYVDTDAGSVVNPAIYIVQAIR